MENDEVKKPIGDEVKAGKKYTPSIASRGIPSKESIWLPAHYSPEIRAFQNADGSATMSYWTMEELMSFVFPPRWQRVYNQIAVAFITECLRRGSLPGEEIGKFVSTNGISKASFYNKVLPRLKRIGMIKVERRTLVALQSRRKYRPMKVTVSTTFGNYLSKIGQSWLATTEAARNKRHAEEKKLEALGWSALEVEKSDSYIPDD